MQLTANNTAGIDISTKVAFLRQPALCFPKTHITLNQAANRS
jgi:hypothetical protein